MEEVDKIVQERKADDLDCISLDYSSQPTLDPNLIYKLLKSVKFFNKWGLNLSCFKDENALPLMFDVVRLMPSLETI